MSRFVSNGRDWVPLGTYTQPITTDELLERMELTEASREQQQRGIDAWLSCHELGGSLRYGLTKDGFLPPEENAGEGDDGEEAPP